MSLVKKKENEIVIALVGNPNSGKSTVFNALTGSHQHVGNWPGVTVEHKEGFAKRNNVNYKIIDLPGIYSLSAYSQEEVVARDFLLDNHVDVVVNILDASNLERNLYLTTQLMELGISLVVVLNMTDVAESLGQSMDVDMFADMLGVQVVSSSASKKEGVEDIFNATLKALKSQSESLCRSTRYNPEIESEIAKLETKVEFNKDCEVPVRWAMLKSLEGDLSARKRLLGCAKDPEKVNALLESTKRHMERVLGDDLEALIADGRYGFIGGLLREVIKRPASTSNNTITDKIDSVLLNRLLGIPIFLVLMWLTFKLTFDVGGFFVGYIDSFVTFCGLWVDKVMPAGPIHSLISDGIIRGVGGVLVFLPNIAAMFVMISFLEDSGYMARAAFIMDRTMHVLGLHGKSFIPMLMGFGCNVPAIMACRTLDTREDRLITIMVNPLMSCTARLPIYVLFTGVFFSKNGALVIFSIYALGIILAVLIAKLLRKTFFASSVSPFVMELPPYRMPTLSGTAIHVWERTSLFISKNGTVILASSIIIWALGSLPIGVKFAGVDSIAGKLGHFLEPLVKPLGMNWQAAVALFFGIGAKEIVVSTLGVLSGSSGGPGQKSIQEAILHNFTPVSALAFMVISLIYIPCVATIAAIKRETSSWKWTLFAISYSLVLAYIMGFLVYRVGMLITKI